MKKFNLLLFLMIYVTFSCSKDETNSSNDLGYILLKKSITTHPSGTINTTEYVYNNNKIVSASSDDFKINYFYTNDLISKIEVNDNQIITKRTLFIYDGSQNLIEKNTNNIEFDEFTQENYQYNTDGTIGVKVYKTDQNFQNELIETYKYFFGSNIEISKIEQYLTGGIKTTNYVYDNKNNIFKNVLNFKKFLLIDSNIFNLVSSQTTLNGNVIFSKNSQLTYNSNDFPLTNTVTNISGTSSNSFTVQHFYN